MAKAEPIVVGWSEVSSFRDCPLKHRLEYVERWTKPAKAGSALDRGTRWHLALEEHYLVLKSLQDAEGMLTVSGDEALERCSTAALGTLIDPGTGEVRDETDELVAWMYEGFLEHWGIDRHWQIVAVEHRVEIPIRTLTGRPSRYRLKGKIDLIVRDLTLGGHLWVVDHKSGKDLPKRKALELDDQFGFYTLALQRMGKPVFGQVYDAARTQRNKTGVQTTDSRFLRERMYRDDAELLEIERDLYKTVVAAYGKPPAALAGADPGAHPDPDRCAWKCSFLEPHLMARKGGDLRGLLVEFGFEQRFERH